MTDVINSSNKNDFDLRYYILSVLDKYDFPNITPVQKHMIRVGININKGTIINRLLSNEDGIAKSQEHKYFPKDSQQHIEGCNYLENIFLQLGQGEKSINQAINKLRQDGSVSFCIIESEEADAYATTQSDGKKEIAFQAGMFTRCDAGTIALVLGHELAHIIEQQDRPEEGKIEGINCKAVELFCDVVGKTVAEGAGYDTSQFSQLLETASLHRNADDSKDDHPSAINRLSVLDHIPTGIRDRDQKIPQYLQNLMQKENWPQHSPSLKFLSNKMREGGEGY